MRREPSGSNKVRRIVEVSVEAVISGVGLLIDSTFAENFRELLDKSAAFMNSTRDNMAADPIGSGARRSGVCYYEPSGWTTEPVSFR